MWFNWVAKAGFSKQNSKAGFPMQKDASDARKHTVGTEMRWRCWKEHSQASEFKRITTK